MPDVAISVQKLAKKYTIQHQQGRQSYTALRDILSHKLLTPWRWLRKEKHVSMANFSASEEFWALQGISFDINQGEVVGIIGRNGAGKSTLLKVLSRITEPTEGSVRICGRIASLLEVGTGFHPELTGRENIYLNGAILGMSRLDIARKFDEIVCFAEVEKFLDTAVKRYSSGMYMRLAFAVAAHLDPEILVVDEVLAVGDLEFQKKCLGKMSDVAKGGRTILFVSHNMAAIKSLTSRGLVMQKGKVVFDGESSEAIEYYTKDSNTFEDNSRSHEWGSGSHTKILQVRLLEASGEPTSQYTPGDKFFLEIIFFSDGTSGLSLEAFLCDAIRSNIALASTYQFHGETLPVESGTYRCELILEPIWLASGRYSFDLTTSVINSGWDHYVESAVEFDVLYSNPLGYPFDFKQSYGYGVIAHLNTSVLSFEPFKISAPPGEEEAACY